MNLSTSLATRAALATGALALAVVGMTGAASSASAAGVAKDPGKAPLSSLVTAGTLTQAQATAVKVAMVAAHDANKAAHDRVESSTLAGLVSAGTLTESQSDAIAAADGRQGMRGLVRSGVVTRELAREVHAAVKTAMDAVATKPEAVLASLVSAGTITLSQADAIEAARPAREHGPRAA
ncbi:MAG: hypothetical protein F2840_13465 [Actinobacteria bacterium]|uniref:Unannotated protein n=1 Tax=freshwater metagenome TaxID=449393 RepID=A0A6J7LIM7_9ZZZZ|nr:hypothetical protein [Actinomycetota bacterium]